MAEALQTTPGTSLEIAIEGWTGVPGDSLVVTMQVVRGHFNRIHESSHHLVADSTGTFRITTPPLEKGTYLLLLYIDEPEVRRRPRSINLRQILVAAPTPEATDTP